MPLDSVDVDVMVTCSSINGYTLVLFCIVFVCVGATKFKPVNVQSFRQRL